MKPLQPNSYYSTSLVSTKVDWWWQWKLVQTHFRHHRPTTRMGLDSIWRSLSGVLLRRQILKRQLLRQMFVRKLLISCSFDEIMMQILMKSFDVVLRNGILLPKFFWPTVNLIFYSLQELWLIYFLVPDIAMWVEKNVQQILHETFFVLPSTDITILGEFDHQLCENLLKGTISAWFP